MVQRGGDSRVSGARGLLEFISGRQRARDVADAGQVEAANLAGFHGDRRILAQAVLKTGAHLARIRGREAAGGAVRGVGRAVERSGEDGAAREQERLGGGWTRGELLEALAAVLLQGFVEKGERIPVKEQAGARADH